MWGAPVTVLHHGSADPALLTNLANQSLDSAPRRQILMRRGGRQPMGTPRYKGGPPPDAHFRPPPTRGHPSASVQTTEVKPSRQFRGIWLFLLPVRAVSLCGAGRFTSLP